MSFSHLIPLLVKKKADLMFPLVKPILEMENGFPICLCPLLSNGFLKFLSFDHSRFFFLPCRRQTWSTSTRKWASLRTRGAVRRHKKPAWKEHLAASSRIQAHFYFTALWRKIDVLGSSIKRKRGKLSRRNCPQQLQMLSHKHAGTNMLSSTGRYRFLCLRKMPDWH